MDFNLKPTHKRIIAFVSLGALILYALPWTKGVLSTYADKEVFACFPVITIFALAAIWALWMIYNKEV